MTELTCVGRTTDQRAVVSGRDIFKLKDTEGFPLAMSFMQCALKGLEIDWCGLIDAAREHGWWDLGLPDHGRDQ